MTFRRWPELKLRRWTQTLPQVEKKHPRDIRTATTRLVGSAWLIVGVWLVTLVVSLDRAPVIIAEKNNCNILIVSTGNKTLRKKNKIMCWAWNTPIPNQFMHQNQISDGLERSSKTKHVQWMVKVFQDYPKLARMAPEGSETIHHIHMVSEDHNLFLMHKLIRIHSVFYSQIM